METQLTQLFDTFNVNETDQLLEKDIDIKIEAQTLSHIKALTFQKIKGKKKKFFAAHFRSLRAAAVAVFVFTAVGGVTGYAYYKEPIAYLDIDINPSIEIGINRWDRIVTAKGYNSDGKNVLKAKSVLNKRAEEGVKTIIETANEQGFLSKEEGAVVAITSLTDDTDKAEALTDVSKEVVEQYIKEEELDVEVVIEHIALARLEEARELGITPGKLNLIQKLQAFDDTITALDYKDATVKEIMKTAIALKKEQKFIQKQEKAQSPEDSSTSDENEELIEIDEDNAEKSSEINKDDRDRKLDGEVKNAKNNTKVTDKEVKVNINSGNKPISPKDTKEDIIQDIKEGTKQETVEDIKQDTKQNINQNNSQGNKQDNDQNNNQDVKEDNKQSNNKNTGQEKVDNTKKVKK